MLQNGHVLFEQEFTLEPGEEVVLTAWEGYNEKRSERGLRATRLTLCFLPRDSLEEILEGWDADVEAVGFLDRPHGRRGPVGRMRPDRRARAGPFRSVRSTSNSGSTRPFSPGSITSRTGGTSEPSTTQPLAIAFRSDHESTNGAVR